MNQIILSIISKYRRLHLLKNYNWLDYPIRHLLGWKRSIQGLNFNPDSADLITYRLFRQGLLKTCYYHKYRSIPINKLSVVISSIDLFILVILVEMNLGRLRDRSFARQQYFIMFTSIIKALFHMHLSRNSSDICITYHVILIVR